MDNTIPQKPKRLGVKLLVSYLCFTFSAISVYILEKGNAISRSSQLLLSGFRLCLGGLILLVIARFLKVNQKMRPELLWRYILIGLLMFGIAQGLQFIGMSLPNANPAQAAMIDGGLLSLLLIFYGFKKRIWEWRSLLLIVVLLGGLAVFLEVDVRAWRPAINLSTAYFVGSTSALIAGILVSERLLANQDKTLRDQLGPACQRTSCYALAGGVGTLAWVYCVPGYRADLGSTDWVYIALLAILGTCLGWVSWFYLQQLHATVAITAIIALTVITPFAVWGLYCCFPTAFPFLASSAVLSAKQVLSAIIVACSLLGLVVRHRC